MSRKIPKELLDKVDEFISSFYFDVQSPTAGGNNKFASLSEDYIIKLLTKILASLVTAYWSATELRDYITNRRRIQRMKLG